MITTIIIFIVILAILVLAHEWGHFITAKKFGCHVEEFGFGFPPRAFGIKSKKYPGMIWSINWLPFGGFVKIKGENGEDDAADDSFASKSATKRITILAAGVIMNILVAVVLMQIVMGVGAKRMIDDRISTSAIIENHQVQIIGGVEDSPAFAAGLEAGDVITEIEGYDGQITVDGIRQFLNAQGPDKVRGVSVLRDGQPTWFNHVGVTNITDESVGWGVFLVETGIVSYPWHIALWKGVEETMFITTETFKGLGGMISGFIQGDGLSEDVAGPVGIAVITGKVVEQGLVQILQFIALLSVNLAILNILPIPALDGGRILFVIIEKLRGGKAVRAQIEGTVHLIGFVVLLGLIVLVTYRDIVMLITG